MSPEFRSLLAKEWMERRRLFLFGVGCLVVYLGYCLAYELEHRTQAFVASFSSTCQGFGWLAAVLLAMTTATGESMRGSLKFSASLPVSLKQVGWARLLDAWSFLAGLIVIGALLITPFVASGLFEQTQFRPAYAVSGGDHVSFSERPIYSRLEAVGALWLVAAIAIVSSIYLVTLMSLAGTWCRTEGTVGFLAAIILLIERSLGLIRSDLDKSGYFLASDWIGGLIPSSLTVNWGYGERDGSNYTDLELAPLLLGPLLLNCLLSGVLGSWFARRYGRRSESAVPVAVRKKRWWISRLPNVLSRLGVRWPGRAAALVWLNARRSLPLCLAGLMMAVLLTFVGLTESRSPAAVTAKLAGELPNSTWFVGMLWGAIVAVGVFSSELKPGLEQFWRSRPISPASWFWIKFAVGLAALLITLDLIPAWLSRATSYRPDTGQVGVAYAACLPLLHALIYAFAVAAICRWRRPIPAAIAALIAYFLLDQILESIPVSPQLSTMNVYNQLESQEFDHWNKGPANQIDLTSEGYPVVYGTVAVLIIAATAFARRAVISSVAGKAKLWIVLLALCAASHSLAAEPPTPAEILQGVERREAIIHSLHMKVATSMVRTAEFFSDVAPQARRPNAQATTAHEERKAYEFFDRPPCRAWTEFDADGRVRLKVAYDGMLKRDFNPRAASRSLEEGRLNETPQPPRPPFLCPQTYADTVLGNSFHEWLRSIPESVAAREADGEQLVDLVFRQTIPANPAENLPNAFEHRYRITVNVSRDFWPVSLERETRRLPDGVLILRTTLSTEGWIDAGPTVFPQRIELQQFLKAQDRPDDSEELLLAATQICDVEFIAANVEIPESVFANPFPPGATYFDDRDRRYYETDAAGRPQAYVPRPRGMRGAVFVYHLIWITLAGVVCWSPAFRRFWAA